MIDRAATGEFGATDDSFRASKCGEVLKMLDGFVEKLRPRDREALLLRLGSEGGRVLTLERIGAR